MNDLLDVQRNVDGSLTITVAPAMADALAVMGTWRYDDQGRITGEYVVECAGERIVVDFQATVECEQDLRLLGTAKIGIGNYRFEAEPAAVSP